MTDAEPDPRSRSAAVTGLLVAAFLALWLMPWAVLIVVAPRVVRAVSAAGVRLPAASREVIELGMILGRNAGALMPGVLAFGLAAGGLAAALRHRPRWGRTVTRVLIAAIVVLLLVNVVVGYCGVVWPQMDLAEAMRHGG